MKNWKSVGGDENHENRRKSNDFSTSTSNRNMSVNKNKMKKKKNFKRLGGGPGGLSLEAFANAKTKNNNYNPALIKKKREFYKNAKCVSKYKKTLKQLSNQKNDQGGQSKDLLSSSVLSAQVDNEEQYETGNVNKRDYMHKRDNVYKRDRKMRNYNEKGSNSLEEIYARKWEEKEKERMEREAIIKAKKEEREKAEARRKDLKEKMLKKTRKGQPVMKYRIEHLLETLRNSGT